MNRAGAGLAALMVAVGCGLVLLWWQVLPAASDKSKIRLAVGIAMSIVIICAAAWWGYTSKPEPEVAAANTDKSKQDSPQRTALQPESRPSGSMPSPPPVRQERTRSPSAARTLPKKEAEELISKLVVEYERMHPGLSPTKENAALVQNWVDKELKRRGYHFRAEVKPNPTAGSKFDRALSIEESPDVTMSNVGIYGGMDVYKSPRLKVEDGIVTANPNAPMPVPEPPPLKLQFSQEAVASRRDDAPYALKVTVQTNTPLRPTSLAIKCTAEVIEGTFRIVGSGSTMMSTGNGHVGDARVYWLWFREPEFKPDTPIVVTLMAKQPIRVVSVYEGPEPPN